MRTKEDRRNSDKIVLRRGFLRIISGATVSSFLLPFMSLVHAVEKVSSDTKIKSIKPTEPKSVLSNTISPKDERTIRRLFDEGWNRGNISVLRTAGNSESIFKHYHGAFPDMRVSITSMLRQGNQILVRWTAQGTHRGKLDNISPTNKRATLTGETQFEVIKGGSGVKFSKCRFDENAIKRQLTIKSTG